MLYDRLLFVRRLPLIGVFLLGFCINILGHDLSTSPITWNREVSRIIYARCASCHHDGGTAFSLMTYQQAQTRAVAIKNAVLSRQMPPWGAVKGFGDFRNDQALTQEQIELITDWVESDTPKGNNPNTLAKTPQIEKPPVFARPINAVLVSEDVMLSHGITLDGLWPQRVPESASAQILATLPNGSIEPLLWLYGYKNRYRHPFLLRKPLELPAGTVIHGVPRGASIFLIPGMESTGAMNVNMKALK